MSAVSRSAEDHVAVRLRFSGNQLRHDFILAVSKQIGVVDETKHFFVRFALRKVYPEELG